ncbi:MAG: hypothetical protein Q9195_003879 [Heterodermia aff. obscurata]
MATESSQTSSRQVVTEEPHHGLHQSEKHLDHPPVGKQGEESDRSHDTRDHMLDSGEGGKSSAQPDVSSGNEGSKDLIRDPAGEGLSDAGLERPLTIERYLQEGARPTRAQNDERECFDKGGRGMRQYLEYWQQKWNAITKRNGT